MNHSPRFLRTFLARRCIAAAAFSCVLVAQASAAQPISVAETLLFQTNHLHNVRAPQTLTYAMRKEGSLEPGFVDEVQVTLAANPAATPAAGPQAGKPKVTMHFLTGARERPVPDADSPEGNPVLLGFLERDIAEMARLTGGAGNYFRKRIRLALAESAQVQPRRFTYAGKAFDGKEISITPYLFDPLRQRFEQYVNKRYSFVVSDKVPGGLYQIHTAVTGPAGAPPLIDETLTLVSAESGKR